MYGIRLDAHDLGALELADLVAHLPPGCALWRATGGQIAWSDEMHLLSAVEYGIRVLRWMKTEDGSKGRKPPKPIEPPKYAHEVTRKADEQDARARLFAEMHR